MGQCIFCGTIGKMTREHIWADWLRSYIPKDMPDHQAGTIIRGGPGEKPIKEFGHRVGGDPRSRRVRCVCGSVTYGRGSKQKGCNDGWMGDLQNRAKPVVLPLIKGEATVLRAAQQRTLSAWIAMAVMCSEHGDIDWVTIPAEHRTYLFKNHTPPKIGWKIWIGRYHRDKWSPHWVHHTLRIAKKETGAAPFAGTAFFNTQSTPYTVGELYIHAVSSWWPRCVNMFRFRPPRNLLLRQIWPVRDEVIRWPPRILTDQQAHDIATSFFDSIQLAGTPR
jgi:hypothetical protein